MRFSALLLTFHLTLTGFTQTPPESEARKVVIKALAATGWDKHTTNNATWKDKGKITFDGVSTDFTSEVYVTYPDKYRWTMTMKFNGADLALTVILNDGKGWETAAGRSQELAGNKLEYLLNELHQMNALSLRALLEEKQFELKLIEDATVDGQRCVGLTAAKKDRPVVKLWFDAASGLPVKLACTVKNEFDNWKDANDELFLSEWSDDGGHKTFKKMKIVRNGKVMIESECSDFKQPEKVDAKLYEKP